MPDTFEVAGSGEIFNIPSCLTEIAWFVCKRTLAEV